MDKTMEYILEVAKCGGITKAASNLYITPSALSKFVQNKEEELQVKLFNRIGKKFVLTYAGEKYIEMLKQMLDLKQEMDIEMSRISSIYMGRLRIGFQLSMAETMISKVIPDFQKNHPNIQIMLEEHNSVELINMLRRNELDIIIINYDYPSEEFDYHSLAASEMVVAVPKGSLLITRTEKKPGFRYPWIDFKDCLSEKAILLEPRQIFRKFSNQVYQHYNVKPDISMLVKSTRTALLCVANEMGITITMDQLVYLNNYQNEVDILSFGESALHFNLGAVANKNNIYYEETLAFVDICKKYLCAM